MLHILACNILYYDVLHGSIVSSDSISVPCWIFFSLERWLTSLHTRRIPHYQTVIVSNVCRINFKIKIYILYTSTEYYFNVSFVLFIHTQNNLLTVPCILYITVHFHFTILTNTSTKYYLP